MKQGNLARRLKGTAAIALGASLLTGAAYEFAVPPSHAAVPATVLSQTGGFGDLVEQVMPAVVSIQAKHSAPKRAMTRGGMPEGFPFPFPGMPHQGPDARRGSALGSGFVIDPSGYVVTNNHVVEGADEIAVQLQDGTELDAELVGTDPKTDLALLKVEAGKPLPHVEFADSDKVRVGDAVVAVGNPFGLGGTATAGIVSARARDIGAGPYDDFLQIDAAINSGNSGGPTFDLQGKVVGINTAIFSPSGGSVGIGFAIPANLARSVVADLREHGRVDRSWIGVQIQPVTPDIAESLGKPGLKGALVADVTEDGPAAKSSLRQGDVITDVAGEPIDDVRELTRRVAGTKAGEPLDLTVFRDGKTTRVSVVPGPMPGAEKVAAARGAADSGKLGLAVAPLDRAARQRLDLPEGTSGVLVMESDPRHGGKVRPGDVITAAGGKSVDGTSDVAAAVEEAQRAGRRSVLLRVHRDGADRYVALDIAKA